MRNLVIDLIDCGSGCGMESPLVDRRLVRGEADCRECQSHHSPKAEIALLAVAKG